MKVPQDDRLECGERPLVDFEPAFALSVFDPWIRPELGKALG
jgi:hypothetical protein